MSTTPLDSTIFMRIAKPIFTDEPAVYIATCTDKLNRHVYTEDCKFFEQNPHRRLHIRQAMFNEYDDIAEIGDYMQVPEQHVLVIQIAKGIHLCMFVYYGRKYANVLYRSDVDVVQVLQKMSSEQGRSLDETLLFARRVMESEQQQPVVRTVASGKVH